MNLQKTLEPSRDKLAKIEIEPFSNQLKPIIEETLIETEKDNRSRKGTLFTPMFTVFVVLGLVMHHELAYDKVVNWLISTIRWLSTSLPKKIIADGTLTKARQYLGVDVFRLIFEKLTKKHYKSTIDFLNEALLL